MKIGENYCIHEFIIAYHMVDESRTQGIANMRTVLEHVFNVFEKRSHCFLVVCFDIGVF